MWIAVLMRLAVDDARRRQRERVEQRHRHAMIITQPDVPGDVIVVVHLLHVIRLECELVQIDVRALGQTDAERCKPCEPFQFNIAAEDGFSRTGKRRLRAQRLSECVAREAQRCIVMKTRERDQQVASPRQRVMQFVGDFRPCGACVEVFAHRDRCCEAGFG